MWFATDKGASRFDGKNFKNYTLLDGIADNNILNFFEDKQNRLWLLTYNGSSCYIKNDTVFNATNNPLLKKIPGLSYTRVMCDGPDSSVYISYNQGTIVHVEKDTARILKTPPHFYVSALRYTAPYLIVYGNQGIVTYTNDTIITQQTVPSDNTTFIYGDKVLTADLRGVQLMQNGRMLLRYNNDTLSFYNVIRLYADNENNIFCCTHTGLYFIDYKTKEKTCILPDIVTSGINQDIYGNYWVSTLNDGVYYFNKEFNNIHLLKQIDNDYVTTSGNDQYFLVSRKHLHAMDELGLEEIVIPTYKLRYKPICNTPEILLYNTPNTNIYSKSTRKTISLVYSFEKTCIAYSKDTFFCHTNNLISSMFIHGKEVETAILKETDVPEYNYQGKILGNSYDSANHELYILTTAKLYKHELPTFKQYLLDSFNALNTPVRIFSFNNRIVILTNINHIIVYDKTTSAKSPDLVFPDHAILDFFDIGDNQAIIYTNDGYYLLTVNFNAPWKTTFTKIEYPFNESDITAMYPIGRNIYCNVNGSLYFFEKNLINKKISKPFFYIDDITVNNVKSPDKHQLLIQNTTNSNIHLSLSSLYYNNAHIKYKYRITSDKHAGQWLLSNSEDFNITLPDYGRYTIELKAVTANNNTSGSKYISVQWNPPFYLTTWFKILAAILMIDIVIYALYRYNRKRRKQHESELNHLQLENKAINSLLNPHFIFNAINNIQNLVNQNASDDANDYLAMLSRLIRQNIENLQHSLIPLEKELNLIHNYIHLQNLRFGGKIKLEVFNATEGDAVYIPPLLIHTFVENAVVHGFNSQLTNFKITITITKLPGDYISIDIKDNGIGLQNAAQRERVSEKSSLGIEMTRKRVERLSLFYKVDYDLQIIDRNSIGAQGTEVNIKIYSKFRELLNSKE